MISKIICFLLLLIVPIINISADSEGVKDELENITDDVEIRYKWYKEEIVGDYYPVKSDDIGYMIDWGRIKYGEYSVWSREYCDMAGNYYNIETRDSYNYSKVPGVRYIKITNFKYDDNVFVYFKNALVSCNVVVKESNYVIIDLKKYHKPDDLTIYIKDATGYTVYLGRVKDMNSYYLHKENTSNNEIMIPDVSWIDDNTYFEGYITSEHMRDTALTKKIETFKSCRYREVYVYKYKIEKKYYDDNYHTNVDGYIKDMNDYQIFYKNKVINNVVTVYEDKLVEKPVKEYVYVDIDDNNAVNDNAEINVDNKEVTDKNNDIVEDTYVDNANDNMIDSVDVNENNDKEIIYKIPRWIYLIMILVLILIIFLVIKICRLKYLASIVEED